MAFQGTQEIDDPMPFACNYSHECACELGIKDSISQCSPAEGCSEAAVSIAPTGDLCTSQCMERRSLLIIKSFSACDMYPCRDTFLGCKGIRFNAAGKYRLNM